MIQLNIPGAYIRRRNHNISIVGVFDYQITSSYSDEICSIDDIRRRAYSRPLDYACWDVELFRRDAIEPCVVTTSSVEVKEPVINMVRYIPNCQRRMTNRIKGFCEVESNDHHVRIAREQLSSWRNVDSDEAARKQILTVDPWTWAQQKQLKQYVISSFQAEL